MTGEQVQTGSKNSAQFAVWVLGVIVVGVIAFAVGSSSDEVSAPTTTAAPTTTVNPNVARLDEAASLCGAEAFYDDEQIVFSLDGYASAMDVMAMACVAENLMSTATHAQFGASSAMTGLQEVKEDGLVFKFSYNGVSETSLLSVTIDD